MRTGIHQATAVLTQLRRDIEHHQNNHSLDAEALAAIAIALTKQCELALNAINQLDRLSTKTLYDMTHRSHRVIDHHQLDLPIANLARALHIPRLEPSTSDAMSDPK